MLSFGIEKVLLPLVGWSMAFLVGAVFVGIVVATFAGRRAGESGSPWLGRFALAIGCFFVPIGAALFHGVPYAIEQSLATGLDGATPDTVNAVIDFGSQQAMSVLNISDEDAVVDVRALRANVSALISNLPATTSADMSMGAIGTMTQAEFLKLVQSSLDSALPSGNRVRWKDVVANARNHIAASVNASFGGFTTALRAAASLHLYWAAVTIAMSNIVTFVFVRFAVYRRRGAQPEQQKTEMMST
ncbi:MAG TPA: hypothetical protein VFA59_17275 [Vicinamibacterales bacterium]|nr:hypothetical protein [Vicinamibacterales bacterium]